MLAECNALDWRGHSATSSEHLVHVKAAAITPPDYTARPESLWGAERTEKQCLGF